MMKNEYLFQVKCLSLLVSLLCGVPQGSGLGQIFLYDSPLGAILKHHNNYICHLKEYLKLFTKLNICLPEIRVWIIKINFKMNDSKT